MISLTYLLVFVFCSAYSAAVEQVQEEGTTIPPASEDVAQRELTDTGYVIRYRGSLYRLPLRIAPLVRAVQTEERNPTETNEIENVEDKNRPLFYFTTYEATNVSDPQGLPTSRPYIEIRRKRDVDSTEIPESSKVAKLRRKRTYCGKCGHGGYGGYSTYYVPVTYAVYPVYIGGYGGGGRGKGCHTCGHGGGGGGGGSYSYSTSSASSSSGSFGWGKK